MMYVEFTTPHEMGLKIAQAVKEKRLSENLSQKTLSDQSGVSIAVLKKFETTGKISLESLLKLAFALRALQDFQSLFKIDPTESYKTLDDLMKQTTRKRGRR